MYMIAREDRGALANADVRRAISLAIDRALLTRTLLAGHAQPASGMIPPTQWSFTPGAPPLAFDPNDARTRLEAAGARGAHLAILTSTDRLRLSITRAIAQELEDAGLIVDVVPLDLGTMIARMNAGDFELAILQMPEFSEPHLLRHFLHSDFVPPEGSNRGRVRDAELDRLIERAASVRDTGARRAAYVEVEARLRDQMHVIPLWYEDQVAVTSARARAFTPSAEGRWLSLATLP
jgi:peptide/nickel transport system substrate-binding protein